MRRAKPAAHFLFSRRGYESLRRVVSAIILVTVCFVAINFWDDPGPLP